MDIRDVLNGEPEVGDIVEMELGDHLVETVIDEVLDDGVVIRVNEEMLTLMIEHNRQLNESRAQQAAIAVNMKKAGKKPKNQPLDEISSKLAGEYYSAATKQHVDKVGMRPNMYDRIERDMGAKRKQGMDRAFDRMTRDPEKVDENNSTRDPWKDKHFGPTTSLKKIFKVTVQDSESNRKAFNVKAETEQQAREVIEKHAPGSTVESIKFVKNLMAMEEADDPCWKGYKQVGMKDKDGRRVPNCVPNESVEEGKTGPGLWANIHAKRKRIKAGSGERMREPGSEGAPKASDFKAAAKNESSNYGDLDERSIGDAVTAAKNDREEKARKEWEYQQYVSPDKYGILDEAKYQGREVTLNQPMAGDVKKSKVYVKNAKGKVVKVNFGQKGVKIKKSNPKRRKSFRARHGCDNPGPKWKAKYWSCRAW